MTRLSKKVSEFSYPEYIFLPVLSLILLITKLDFLEVKERKISEINGKPFILSV